MERVSADAESFDYLVLELGLLGLDFPVATRSRSSKGRVQREWVMSCFEGTTGGFAGNTGHDIHILYTLSALQILALYNLLDNCERLAEVEWIVCRRSAGRNRYAVYILCTILSVFTLSSRGWTYRHDYGGRFYHRI
jgi:hypothetical protein